MNDHDDKIKVNTNSIDRLNKNLSSEFSKELKLDDVLKQTNDPFILSMIVHKLIQERQETNRLVNEINRKYDELLFKMREIEQKQAPLQSENSAKKEFDILSEQDEKIIALVKQKGKVSAYDIQSVLKYKGQNGASARLNKLTKEGWLKKLRAGKITYFISAWNHFKLNLYFRNMLPSLRKLFPCKNGVIYSKGQ